MVKAETVRHIVFPSAVGSRSHGRSIASMVGVAQSDDVVVSGVGSGHEEGEVVGLRARVDKVAHLEIARHFRSQFGGVVGHIGMEIDGRRMLVELALLVSRRNDVRMAVADADRNDPAEAVEVALTLLVPDILHPTFHHHKWLFVIKKNTRIDELLAQ